MITMTVDSASSRKTEKPEVVDGNEGLAWHPADGDSVEPQPIIFWHGCKPPPGGLPSLESTRICYGNDNLDYIRNGLWLLIDAWTYTVTLPNLDPLSAEQLHPGHKHVCIAHISLHSD